jgi:hypothetical protein
MKSLQLLQAYYMNYVYINICTPYILSTNKYCIRQLQQRAHTTLVSKKPNDAIATLFLFIC